MSRVIVVGGGPAGMMAAYAAAEQGHQVLLLEQNEKLGKKLFLTGKGRCNLTNAGEPDELFSHVTSNPKFLYSAFRGFDNRETVAFFEKRGLRTKVERGSRVFPLSDHSSDVIAVLKRALADLNVEVRLNTRVLKICDQKPVGAESPCVRGVSTEAGELAADAVILATGGLSYPSTGSTGDGLTFAAESGHCLTAPTPALVPFEVKEPWIKQLQGLSLKNVSITLYKERKKIYEDFGEMLFTHFGVSGPMILSASGSILASAFQEELSLRINLKPALDQDQLDRRILSDFEEQRNRQFCNSLGKLLPAKLIPVMVELSGIEPRKKVNEVTQAERRHLTELFQGLPLTVTGTRGWDEAIITKGGVSVKDINPSTMESKRVHGLYFCGELLDVDALTGGYNLQIAWSTGHLAGSSII